MPNSPTIKPIRILQLGGSLDLYGAERWILALAKYLDRSAYECIIAVIRDSPEQEPPLCRAASDLGIQSHIFEASHAFDFRVIKAIRKFITRNNIDIIHTHGYKQDIIGRFASIGTRCRNLATPHGWTNNADTKVRFYETLNRLAFYFTDSVAPLSKQLYTELMQFPFMTRKLRLIENCLDISEIVNDSQHDAQLNSLRNMGCFLVGYIGRLVTEKSIDTLINAVARLPNLKVILVIIGSGPELPLLKQFVLHHRMEERVLFLGYRPDRIACLKEFDIFVLPSKSEGIPRCAMEAMAAKVPVVATDIPGCRELVKDHVTGLLFESGDDKALAEAITYLSQDIEARKSIADNAHRLIQERFSPNRMACEYANLYDELSARRLNRNSNGVQMTKKSESDSSAPDSQ